MRRMEYSVLKEKMKESECGWFEDLLLPVRKPESAQRTWCSFLHLRILCRHQVVHATPFHVVFSSFFIKFPTTSPFCLHGILFDAQDTS
jgi:hypothetical protein